MYEIRFHGRGGQGVVLASKILAKALVEDGNYVKAIPAFGFERRGAPVEAYLRFDNEIVRQFTNIYYPDCVICIDPTLPHTVDIFANLKKGATWVQATNQSSDKIKIPEQISKAGFCDAVGIAIKLFERPITNSIMLGAFAKTTGLVSLQSLCHAMESVAFRDAALDKNIQGAHRGYEETTIMESNFTKSEETK
jgi:pyruvate ferredoxin oxidoreductase gamma subunit/phenylglyoxylate dehydrogenase gamma subunit